MQSPTMRCAPNASRIASASKKLSQTCRAGTPLSGILANGLSSPVQVVDPAHQLRHLDRRDVEVHDEALLAAASEHAVQLRILARIELLVRDVRRHVDEVARARLRNKLE